MNLPGYDRWLEAPYQDAALFAVPEGETTCPYKDTDEDDLPEGVEPHDYKGACTFCGEDVCGTCNPDEDSTCGRATAHLTCHRASCKDRECWWSD